MLAFSSLFVLIAPAMAATSGVCMDLELQFQEQSRIAAEADHLVRQAEDDVRAHDWMYEIRADLQRDLDGLTADREALHHLLEATGMTAELEASLVDMAETEADILWRISDVEHRIAGLEHEVIIASMHADMTFDQASRAGERLERCLKNIPAPRRLTFGR
jgi:hypothetical protein